MENNMENRTITLSFNDFQELSTDAAAEICAAIDEPEFALFSAMLIARMATKLFTNEDLIIEEGE